MLLVAVSSTEPWMRAAVGASLHRSSPLTGSTPRSSIVMQESHQVNALHPSGHHDKMVNAVVQGVDGQEALMSSKPMRGL